MRTFIGSRSHPALAALRSAAISAMVFFAVAPSVCAPISAQGTAGYPERPVKLVLGLAAGSGPDLITRTLAQKLSEQWGGVGVVVENKPGAAGLIAGTETARFAPDGYTLMLAELGQLCIAPHVYRKLPYHPQKDFVAVSQVTQAGFVLLVDPVRVPARNLREFVASGRQQPHGIFMGTFGPGTPGQIAAYLFGAATKVKTEAVHYKATADAIVGLASGDLHGAFVSVSLALAQIKGGKLIGIASTAPTRLAALPGIPTMGEQGYPGLELSSWSGVAAPAKTPPEIVAKLSADIVKALGPDTRARLERLGLSVTGTTAPAFARTIAADGATWARPSPRWDSRSIEEPAWNRTTFACPPSSSSPA